MTTRHLMALDYTNYQASSIFKKHARNRPLGDIEHRHNYVPAQPVLSCRTVEIDLPGTRTYRPKSTVDILEEQQRLIRQLYSNQRATASAHAHSRTDPSARASPDSIHGVNIEVKGRPLTSSSQTSRGNVFDRRSNTPTRRPKTTGRLKNVRPATNCFMVIKGDQDLQQSSLNKRQATDQIHNYWKTENHNLAVGKFVRGQKRPDDVPPTLDAWLTFGGAAGEESEGLIDAFACFKNSEEYYNIEGSVGSRVAKQLQKGDKIRIGINGVLQSRDLKIKRWNKENTYSAEEEEVEMQQKTLQEEELNQEKEKAIQDTENKFDQPEAENWLDDKELDGDFKELLVDDALSDLISASGEEEKDMSSRKNSDSQNVSTKRAESPVKEIIPLSWEDQCSKPDVKVINARVNVFKEKRQVMSETHPVKFEKLSKTGIRPRLSQPRGDGFKVKKRLSSLKDQGNHRATSAKVKIVYIDPLNQEEEHKIDSLSIEEIINEKVGSRSQNSSAKQKQRSVRNGKGDMSTSEDSNALPQEERTQTVRHNQTLNRLSSNCSTANERSNRIPSPKLKTQPMNSSHSQAMAGNLSIMTPGAQYTPPINEMPRSAKSPGRVSPTKPLHIAGSGSSIKTGPQQGETEYIKITSQLKIVSNGKPMSPSTAGHIPHSHYDHSYRPGSNTPQDGTHSPFGIETEFITNKDEDPFTWVNLSSLKQDGDPDINAYPEQAENTNDETNNRNNDDNTVSSSSVSPAPTTVAISIPTADELSDRDSINNSPSRPKGATDDDLTSFQRRERNLRNEQIDQLTDLLGNAVVDS